jgi:hypothetical protein
MFERDLRNVLDVEHSSAAARKLAGGHLALQGQGNSLILVLTAARKLAGSQLVQELERQIPAATRKLAGGLRLRSKKKEVKKVPKVCIIS